MTPIRLVVAGCAGRMGRRLLALAASDPAFELVAAVAEPGDASVGMEVTSLTGEAILQEKTGQRPVPQEKTGQRPVPQEKTGQRPVPQEKTGQRPAPQVIHQEAVVDGSVRVTAAYDGPADIVVEFTSPDGCVVWADWSVEHKCALVSGTTGIGERERTRLREAARSVPVLWSPNMSVGANLLIKLAAEAAAILGDSAEIEIVETHHNAKVDAPSGTANAILEGVCDALGRNTAENVVYGRSGACGPRPPRQVGVHALRLGRVVGEHEVHLGLAGETLVLRHRAESRDAFAAGALRAARWLVEQPAGLYTMSHLWGQPA